MEKRQLGRTDLDVTALCLGTMTWGEQNTEQQAFEQLDLATSEGINFIDAAEMYPVPPRAETQGLTESYLGNWLAKRGRRDDLADDQPLHEPDLGGVRDQWGQWVRQPGVRPAGGSGDVPDTQHRQHAHLRHRGAGR